MGRVLDFVAVVVAQTVAIVGYVTSMVIGLFATLLSCGTVAIGLAMLLVICAACVMPVFLLTLLQ